MTRRWLTLFALACTDPEEERLQEAEQQACLAGAVDGAVAGASAAARGERADSSLPEDYYDLTSWDEGYPACYEDAYREAYDEVEQSL